MADYKTFQYEDLTEASRSFIRPDSPPGARMAAARGLLPLITIDLVYLLCYLMQDSDQRIAKQALGTISDLPANMLDRVLQSDINPKILDFFAKQKLERTNLYERILLNRNTGDDTFKWLAQNSADVIVLDLIATNQERIIRDPQIARDLTKNKNISASTASLVKQFYTLYSGSDELFADIPEPEIVEESITEELLEKDQAAKAAIEALVEDEDFDEDLPGGEIDEDELDGLDQFESIPEDEDLENINLDDFEKEVFEEDVHFAAEFLLDPERELSNEERRGLAHKVRNMRVVDQMSVALKGNIETRQILIKSSNKLVQECVIRNPRLTIEEVMKVAKNKSMREDIIRLVTVNKDWTKNYQVRLMLVWNPKTPLTLALKYLTMLNERDLSAISKSKQVPGMLAVAARKMVKVKQRFK